MKMKASNKSLDSSSQQALNPLSCSGRSICEPGKALSKAAVLLPACYLGTIVAMSALGFGPIVFGLCLGIAVVLASFVPFLMPLLVWVTEIARAGNLVLPMLVFFGICNCLVLYRFGKYLDR